MNPGSGDERDAAEPLAGVQSIRRALTVLRLVACGQERGVRVSDIALMSGLSRSTVHRLLKVLMRETAVEQDPDTRRYLVGPELALLGLARMSRFPIAAAAEPFLRALAQQVGDAVFLSVRHGADSVCIGRFLGPYQIQVLSIDVGVRRPLGASVSGIVLLAGLPRTVVQRLVQANATRLQLAGTDAAVVLAAVQAARAAGSTYTERGVMPGTSAAAVPILDAKGQTGAAISVAALNGRLDAKRLPVVLEAMREQAAAVTERLQELAAARERKTRRA